MNRKRPRPLSKREQREVERYRLLWREHSLSTEPAARERAESALRTLYLQAGYAEPEIVWCDSPQALIAASADRPGPLVWHALTAAAGEPAWRALFNELDTGSVAKAWSGLRQAMWREQDWHVLNEGKRGMEFPIQPELGDVVARREGNREQVGLWTCVSAERFEGWSLSMGYSLVSTWIGDLLPTFAFAREVLGLEGGAEISPLIELARSAGPWLAHRDAVFVCERPCELHLDERERLHREDGPALCYPDGACVYAWHGVRVPRKVIESPERVPLSRILREPNLEVRRAMLECVGWERCLQAPGVKLLNRDRANGATLWQLALPELEREHLWHRPVSQQDEPLVLLELENATVELDGSRRRYVLRVPPDIRRARAALAWTFDLPDGAYRLTAQS